MSLLCVDHPYAQTIGSPAYCLEEIVITGRERKESLRDAPVPISVVGN